MQLAILFWFYKDLELCGERVRLLRRLNPRTPIYGLYGGSPEPVDGLAAIQAELDDLYVFPEPREAHWKWLNGDRLIAAWMRDRGGALPWDTVVIVQWDMLVLGPVESVFAGLNPGEAVFSGFRPLDEVAAWWGWAGARDPEKRAMLDAFRSRLLADHAYAGPLWCALFIVVALPRAFLARYAGAGTPEQGFLEYKMPTLAQLWGARVRTDLPFNPWWAADPATKEAPERARALNAVGREVPLSLIQSELADPGGLRVFHPFSGPFPVDALSSASAPRRA
jgi:hypothetical protein